MDTVVIDGFLLHFHSSLSVLTISLYLCLIHFVTSLHYPGLSPSFSLSLSLSGRLSEGFFKEPVSCEIAQIATALRLARRMRKRKTKRQRREGRFSAPTLLNCSYLHQYSNHPHTHTHEHTQLQHAVPDLLLLSLSMLSGQTPPPPFPSSTHIDTHPCSHSTTPSPLCFTIQVTSLNNLAK